ncbi:MAG: tetratricopeptide repeat protein, partial [Actinomycetota bacterium]|nr:tetratricopeptide repeat protein [Actinomycetota bacterium]
MAGDLATIEMIARQQIEVCERVVSRGCTWAISTWDLLPTGGGTGMRRTVTCAVRFELEPPGAFEGQSAAHLALHLAQAGRVEEAVAIAEERFKGRPPPARSHTLGNLNTVFVLSETLYLAVRPEAPAALYGWFEETLAKGIGWITFDCRLMETRAGISAAAARRWQEAEAHFQRALELAVALPHHIEQADVRRFYSRTLLDRDAAGDRQRARELLTEAIDEYRSIGMSCHVERAG